MKSREHSFLISYHYMYHHSRYYYYHHHHHYYYYHHHYYHHHHYYYHYPIIIINIFRFQAEPSGTFWYHAHSANGFSMGLHGAFIIYDPEAQLERVSDVSPSRGGGRG